MYFMLLFSPFIFSNNPPCEIKWTAAYLNAAKTQSPHPINDCLSDKCYCIEGKDYRKWKVVKEKLVPDLEGAAKALIDDAPMKAHKKRINKILLLRHKRTCLQTPISYLLENIIENNKQPSEKVKAKDYHKTLITLMELGDINESLRTLNSFPLHASLPAKVKPELKKMLEKCKDVKVDGPPSGAN